MISTIIRDSPVLAGAVAIFVAIILFLIIAVATGRRGSRPDRNRRTDRRREPDFDGDDFDFDDFDGDVDRRGDWGQGRQENRRRRFGYGGLTVSFLLGLTIGVGGLTLAPHLHGARLLKALVGLIEIASSGAREPAKPAAPSVEQTSTPGSAAKSPPTPQPTREVKAPAETYDERDRRLASFVERLQNEIPKTVGPETTLASVLRDNDTVILGYSIARLLSDAEASQLQISLKNTAASTFCSGKSDEVRFLNDHGIEFRLIYVDQVGRTIAKLTAKPHFCDN